MLRSCGIAMLSLVAIGLCFSAIGAAWSAETKAPILLGTVDIDKAYQGYERSASIKNELQAAYEKAQLKLDLMKANKLLNSSEIDELLTLSTKPKQTDADKARIDALLAESKKRDEELQNLEQKKDATDEEKKRLQELTDQRKQAEEAYRKSYEQLQSELNAKEAQLLTSAKKDIVDAVAAVAKEKGIQIILNRSIGVNDFVIYSAVDITDDVIKKLNKK